MRMSQPFARAAAMFSMIAAAMSHAGSNGAMLQTLLNDIPPYVSRGKGSGGRQASRRRVAHDRRAAAKSRNQQRHKKACRA